MGNQQTNICRAGRWFLASGIQELNGAVARYYRADLERNHPVSTEITGYAASVLAYLHSLSGKPEYLDGAVRAAHFLSREAWSADLDTISFEASRNGSPAPAYFFDCGIIVRGLLAVWRVTGEKELLDTAVRCGAAMLRDFDAGDGEYHPILTLPDKRPVPRETHWSKSATCYQLKSAMAWNDLSDVTGDETFRRAYFQCLERSLETYASFLPGHTGPRGVMDRLHPFCYFLEGLMPYAGRPRCAEAIRQGISRTAAYLREISPPFARSDAYAQLLRARLFAHGLGVLPLDVEAASYEAAELAGFQCEHADPRIDGGFYFGRAEGKFLPHVNPASGGFCVQALAMWDGYLSGAPVPPLWLLV